VTTEATASRHYTTADIPLEFMRGAHGIINANGLRLIREFEGPPRTTARLCEGGAWELGPGVTFHLDGTPVQQGETCDEAYGEALFVSALGMFARGVDELVTVPINANMRAALTAFAFNCGVKALAGSTLLKHVNSSRFDAAADAFGMWLYATKGQHKQALRGLLRRRYAEAALFLSYDWTEACADEAVALVRERPPGNVGTDRVLSKTEFKQVLSVAQRWPLPEEELILDTPIKAEPAVVPIASKAGQPVPLPGPAPAAPASKTSASGSSEAVSVQPPAPAPQPTKAEPAPAPVKPPPLPKDAAPTSNDPKDMLLSRRAWGLAVTAVGTTQFVPRGASEWLNNEGNRELLSWLIVVIVGVLLYQYGKYKAKRPLK